MLNNRIEEITYNILSELKMSTASDIRVLQIAEHLGVDVRTANLERNISGFFVMKDNKPYIRYNKHESKQRKRFTIAHELGHFVLHKDISLIVDKKGEVFFRDSNSTTGEAIREREANAFAASLLMPKKFIEDEMRNIPKDKDLIDRLSKKFDVSTQAMTYRLINLGYEFVGIF